MLHAVTGRSNPRNGKVDSDPNGAGTSHASVRQEQLVEGIILNVSDVLHVLWMCCVGKYY